MEVALSLLTDEKELIDMQEDDQRSEDMFDVVQRESRLSARKSRKTLRDSINLD